MADKPCPRCPALEAEIDRLLEIIQTAQNTCLQAIGESDGVMSAGNVPRGQWSYLKGQLETAQGILKILE